MEEVKLPMATNQFVNSTEDIFEICAGNPENPDLAEIGSIAAECLGYEWPSEEEEEEEEGD